MTTPEPFDVAALLDHVREEGPYGQSRELGKQVQAVLAASPDIFTQQPLALAWALRAHRDPREFHNITLRRMLGHTVGESIASCLGDLLGLSEKLASFTEDEPYDFGDDERYAFSVVNKESLKAFALASDRGSYLVVLEQTRHQWTVHLREWFPSLEGLEEEKLPTSLVDLQERLAAGEATLVDVANLAQQLSRFADDGNEYPYGRRPSLAQFRDTECAVGLSDSCKGLRYGDIRDHGYLATVETGAMLGPCAELGAASLVALELAWNDVLSAIDTVGE